MSSELRLIVTVIFFCLFLGISICNVWVILRYYIKKQQGSIIHFIGGLSGLLAVFLAPDSALRPLWWLPLILDFGTIPWIVMGCMHELDKRTPITYGKSSSQPRTTGTLVLTVFAGGISVLVSVGLFSYSIDDGLDFLCFVTQSLTAVNFFMAMIFIFQMRPWSKVLFWLLFFSYSYFALRGSLSIQCYTFEGELNRTYFWSLYYLSFFLLPYTALQSYIGRVQSRMT